jgi:hypothetical protein
LMRWNPPVDRETESADRVMRLAIQEGWRQAVFIYLYMVSLIPLFCLHFCVLKGYRGCVGSTLQILMSNQPFDRSFN